ncbi:MAG: MFS transporter [Haloechinothrix sp.]
MAHLVASIRGDDGFVPDRWRLLGVRLNGRTRRRSTGSWSYPLLLALAAGDSAGYSVIAPVLPELAARTNSGPAMMGALASAFPAAMLIGFAAAGVLVRSGRIRPIVACSSAISIAGAVLFAVATDLPWLFAARALMGLGSGGLWIGVTFATLAYWPGQEYLCMSRIYAAYSAGALLGPALGALGGVARPFLAYAVLLALVTVGAVALPNVATVFGSDRAVLRTRRFWVSVLAIMLAILATGALDGVLPLHFALHLSQAQIGLAYVLVACLIAVGSVAAGHQSPGRMVALGAVAITVGVTVAGTTTTLLPWGVALLLIGLGIGAAQTGATGLLLAAVPMSRIVAALVVWSQLGIVGYLAGPALGGLIAQYLGFGALGLLPGAVVVVLLLLAGLARRGKAQR